MLRYLYSLLLFCIPLEGIAAASTVTVRSEFQRALAAVDVGATPRDSKALREYVLYPYLVAARLQRHLTLVGHFESIDAEIAAFMLRYGSEPVTRALRHEWLLSLAQRKQWTYFHEHYRIEQGDVALRCAALTAQLHQQTDKDLSLAILATWMTPLKLPEQCDELTTWAKGQNLFTVDLIQQRTRLALRKGHYTLARTLLVDLPVEQSAPLSQWVQLLVQPEQTLDVILQSEQSVDKAALLAGWERLARQNPTAAQARFARLITTQHLDTAAASPYALALAKSLSWSRNNAALDYFAQVAPSDFDDIGWEWYARAALWAGDWSRVAQVVESMPSTLKLSARWRYWAARAAAQLHEAAMAKELYEQLIEQEDNYYAVLAAAQLHRPYHPHTQTVSVNKALVRKIAERPAAQRTFELLSLGMRTQAFGEWNYNYEGLQADERYAAIHLANQWGWHDLAVATATRQGVFNDYALLYPRPYEKEVHAAAKLRKVSADFLYGQLRQESLYRATARSSAGALGLMQMLPDTARATAKRWRLPVPSLNDLFKPAVNVPLGAAHMRDLLDKYSGQLPQALAAYNAGPNAVARWLPAMPLDADVWIENIPYNETRNYVQKILWHGFIVHWLQHKKAMDTKSWLNKIH